MSEDDKLNRLPDTWAWSVMSDVCQKIQDGTHFSPNKDRQFATGQFPYVTAKNVRPWGLDLSDITYLEEVDHRQIRQRCDPSQGDVLLVKDGVNAGDAAINTFDGEISLLSSVCMLRSQASVLENRFLRYFLLSPRGSRSLTGQMTGTAIKRVILRKVRDTPVPIAPFNEQRRIVAKIEELFSDLDAGVAALERAKAKLKRYRAAVLKAAVEGKLTEEWRAQNSPRPLGEGPGVRAGSRETAPQLLERILKERRRKWEEDQLAVYEKAGKKPPTNWKAKYKEPAPPATSDLPELPGGWCWATIGHLFVIDSGEAFKKRDYSEGGLRLLQIANVGFGMTLWEQRNFLPVSFADQYGTLLLAAGDVVMALNRPILSNQLKVAMLADKDLPAILYQRVARLRPMIEQTSRYCFHYMLSPFMVSEVRNRLQGTDQPYLNTSLLPGIPIPFPPLEEQKQIIAEVERRLSLAQESETQIEADLKRSSRLRQSILKRAFEGNLVPQDPNDEPATALLERIRQDCQSDSDHRATGSKSGRTKRHTKESTR